MNRDLALYQNDLQVRNGDFIISDSDKQHVMDTINACPGWWKEHPEDGVGLLRFVNSSGQEQRIARLMKINLVSDGYNVGTPEISITPDGEVTITPNVSKDYGEEDF